MTEVRFYHLTRTTLEDALPNLLERALQRDWRAVVVAGSDARVEQLNQHLWTYDERGFLPHGAPKDGFAAHQPVWLTTADENPNGAHVAFLVDGATTERPEAFGLVAEMFDGNDPDAVQAARQRWKAYRAAGHDLTYWQQDERGRWKKGA
jgi:DNA polymerase-3 subunit chi